MDSDAFLGQCRGECVSVPNRVYGQIRHGGHAKDLSPWPGTLGKGDLGCYVLRHTDMKRPEWKNETEPVGTNRLAK
jgi:hypothetical protein